MTTPFLAGEPKSFGFDERDNLATIQGHASAEAAARRKTEAGSVLQFSDVASQPASAQAKYFLNVYFDNLDATTKKAIYTEWQTFCVIQKEASMPEDSPNIPQNLANLFLQRLGRTMTPTEFKDAFKAVDTNFDGKMAYLEYLIWTHKTGSPAHAMYRPQVQSTALFNAINKSLDAERALRNYDDQLAAHTEAAETKTGVAGTRALQELNTFKENTNLAHLNADLASAYEKLLKARSGCTERGTEFWDQTVADEATSRLPQKAQR
jgi:hypothetical protein